MAWLGKLRDWLMPPTEEYDEEMEEEIDRKVAKTEKLRNMNEWEEKIAVNDTTPRYSSSRRFANVAPSQKVTNSVAGERSKLKLYNDSVPTLTMEVHVPQNFDQVRVIGDQLKKKNAVIVNYELLEANDQRRICDFLSGLTYVLEGNIKRISQNIVLYVPNGVDVSDAVLAVA